jgi:transcriptional regulator with XRE-family HTH domain
MAKKAKSNGFTRYTTYNWVDHDPILDVFDTLQQDTGMTFAEISAKSRVAQGTLANWKRRKVKRPQFQTMAAAAVAMGADQLPITPEARRKFRAARK